MGHRTLVAYDRSGSFDLHYAHWRVPPEALTAATPFGGPADEAWARDRAEDLLDPADGRLSDADRRPAVDPAPIATGLTFEGVVDRIDFLEHEALYVVSPGFVVRTYRICRIDHRADADEEVTGRDTSGEKANRDTSGEETGRDAGGALVGYDGPVDEAYVEGWTDGARAAAHSADAGPDAVFRALRWLGSDRGVLVRRAGALSYPRN